MYLVSQTGEEKEKQSMKSKKKNKQCQVILLKPRRQSRTFKGSGNVYFTCETILQGALPLLRIVHDEFDATVRVIC